MAVRLRLRRNAVLALWRGPSTVELAVPPGMAIELRLDWPVQLGGGVSLALQIMGRAVRVQDGNTEVGFKKYDFLTRRD